MKKILVTGADGFIGSHLVELLLEQGYSVRALSYYNSFNFYGWLEDTYTRENLEIVSGDIRDSHFCNSICEGIDAILHLAALIGIPYSYVAPTSYIDVNVNGTINICHAALKNNVKKIIHTSTSEVYGSAKTIPIPETHILQPQSPYSASKISADAMAKSFYLSFDMPLVIARPFNTFGPRQSARAVIPAIISQIASGNTEIQLGNTDTTRDFNYVHNTCDGFLALLESDKVIGETFNIGSGFEISIKDLILKISDIMGAKIKVQVDEKRIRPQKSEVERLCCDNNKIYSETGYTPKISLEEGLKKTVQWFQVPENLAKYKHNIYNV